MPNIYLSPSMQTNNLYATGNTNEMVQCTKIAEACKAALERCGFKVKLAEFTQTLAERCADSDKFDADLHVPIHTNAYDGEVTGTRIFSYDEIGQGYKACKAILATLGAITIGDSDRVYARQELYEIKKPKAPTAYVECEFHDNKKASDWIINNTDKIGEAICEGICNYFYMKYIKNTSKVYRVQVGCYNVKTNAERMKKRLRDAGYDAFVYESEN